MQFRYCSMVVLQSLDGSVALENSMHSSRFDFSSLQTQHGFGFVVATASEPGLTIGLISGFENHEGMGMFSHAITIVIKVVAT